MPTIASISEAKYWNCARRRLELSSLRRKKPPLAMTDGLSTGEASRISWATATASGGARSLLHRQLGQNDGEV
jgi:hypothetical protein